MGQAKWVLSLGLVARQQPDVCKISQLNLSDLLKFGYCDNSFFALCI